MFEPTGPFSPQVVSLAPPGSSTRWGVWWQRQPPRESWWRVPRRPPPAIPVIFCCKIWWEKWRKAWGKTSTCWENRGETCTKESNAPDDGCMVLGALGASNLLHVKKDAGLSWRSRLLAILCRWVSGNEGYDIAILCPHRQLALCNDFLKK